MSQSPYIKSTIVNIDQDLTNSPLIQKFGVIAPSSNSLTVGQVYEFNNPQEALAVVGYEIGLGNDAGSIIKRIYEKNGQSKVYYTSCGTNALSATTANTSVATLAGATVITFASNHSFSNGDFVSIDTGNKIEYRKVITGAGGATITVNKLAFDHASGVAVTKVTQYTAGNLATCRTALLNYAYDFHIEDQAYNNLSTIKTHLDTKYTETNFLTWVFAGCESGIQGSTAITATQALNDYRIRVIRQGIQTIDGIFFGAIPAVDVACEWGIVRRDAGRANDVASTIYERPVTSDILAVVDPYTNTTLSISEADNLTNNNITVFLNKRTSTNIVYGKLVTSYNENSFGYQDDKYTDAMQPEVLKYVEEDLENYLSEYIRDKNTMVPPAPIRTNTVDTVLQNVKSRLESYPFINTDLEANGMIPQVSGVVTGNQLEITNVFKAVNNIDQITIKIIKLTS